MDYIKCKTESSKAYFVGKFIVTLTDKGYDENSVPVHSVRLYDTSNNSQSYKLSVFGYARDMENLAKDIVKLYSAGKI